MLDMVEVLVGPAPGVLGLAPALLAIAEGTFAGDDRVFLVTADLKDHDSWRSCRISCTTSS